MFIHFWYPVCISEALDQENPQRIDMLGVQKTLQQNDGDIAWAIPCPARWESGNWVLDSIPLVK